MPTPPRTPVKPHMVRFAEAVALFVKAPRSVPDLREAMGITNNVQAHRYVRALREEGLLYICEYRRPRTKVYAWQPSVCYYSDVTRP